MDSQAIMTVGAATLALVQLLKRAGLPDRLGAVAVLALAALGVALWAISRGGLGLHDVWDLFAGWIAVATSAAGTFGLARALPGALDALRPGATPER
jgi:hypothetical protein